MTEQESGARKRYAPSRAKHIRRLVAVEFARRSSRSVRRPTRGQTLIIFALTFTVLIGLLGLAIDTIRIYDLYARMQRAAEAGALAGVIYMPNNYTTNLTSSPGDDAVCRAWQETHKNGFGPGCTPGTSVSPGTCPPPAIPTTEITVCNVRNSPYELQVSITESIDVLFIGALNVGPVTLTATALAAYLPPVEIASDPTGTGNTGTWGSFGECGNSGSSVSAACTGKTNVRNWSGNINGPGELKEQGDPLVSCAEGPGSPVNIDSAAPTVLATTYVGMPTNHPQTWTGGVGLPPTGCTNSDATGAFTGITNYDGVSSLTTAPTKVGYAFLVAVPPASQGGVAQSVWVWNAPFSPSPPKSCNGRTGGQNTTSYDIFYYYNCGGSTSSPYPSYPGITQCGSPIGSNFDPYTCLDPKLYFSVTYSIYALSGPTDMVGTPVAAFTAWPYAGQGSCPSGQYQALGATAAPFNSVAVLAGNTCIASPCVANWCPIGNQLGDNVTPSILWPNYALQPGNFYRVMVTVSDYGDPTNPNLGWGGHSYSLKLCPASGTTQGNVQTCTVGGTIGGWNESDALFIFPGGGAGNTQITEYPLGVIDSTFAGRTIDIKMYDPGDLNGTNSSAKGYTLYAVAPPTGAADPCTATTTDLQAAGYSTSNFTFSSGERTSTLNSLPALEPSLKGDLIYNGLWVDEQVTIPASYQYNGNSWTLCALAPQTNDGDVLAIGVFALGQSPVHLAG